MEVLDEGFIRSFIRMADDGWKQGWHERNGGNLSVPSKRLLTSMRSKMF